jgi:hypothetical protein
MRITPEQLKKIIIEEVSKLRSEGINWDPGMSGQELGLQQKIRDAVAEAVSLGFDRMDFIDECANVFDELSGHKRQAPRRPGTSRR